VYADLDLDLDADLVADANAVAVAFLDAREVESARPLGRQLDPQAVQSFASKSGTATAFASATKSKSRYTSKYKFRTTD